MSYDCYCFICGCPSIGISSSYLKDKIQEYIEIYENEMNKKKKNKFDNDFKKLYEQYNENKNQFMTKCLNFIKHTKWMNNTTMLLYNDQIIHNCKYKYNNFMKNSKRYSLEISTYDINEYPFGVYVHTDCWKYIKDKYNIELKYSIIPLLKGSYIFNPIKFIKYGEIEKYMEQYFNFIGIILDNKEYLCSSPLLKDKNINQINKNFKKLKIKLGRNSPNISASFYKKDTIKFGNDKYFWIIKNGKWNKINEEPIKVKIDKTKYNKHYKKFENIGLYNDKPLFILQVNKNDIDVLTLSNYIDYIK